MYSKGVSWIDDCRIPTTDNLNGGGYNTKGTSKKNLDDATSYATKVIESDFIQPQGRFPANILVCDDMLNDGVVSKSQENKSKGDIRKSLINGADKAGGFYRPDYFVNRNNFNDKGSSSRYYNIDKWFENLIK
jgi:hypothetical protein